MTPLKTRILIADDHPIVLRGLRIVLNAQPDLEVIAEASDGDEAVKQALTSDASSGSSARSRAKTPAMCPVASTPQPTRRGRSMFTAQ